MMKIVWLVAIAAGLLNPVQSGLTGALQQALGKPFQVATFSLAVSLACAVVGLMVEGRPSVDALLQAPWWAWLAGLAGAAILVARPIAAPYLGAGAFTALSVTASIVAALLLDHFGWLGFERHAVNVGRLSGALLMIVGTLLVSVF